MDRKEREARQELRKSPAGSELLEMLHLEEMRTLVRAHLAVEGVRQKGFAAKLGMTPDRLRTFLRGAEPDDRDWESLARWCEDKPRPYVHSEAVAVAVLSRWAAKKHAEVARRTFGRAVLDFYATLNFRLPPSVVAVLREP